MRTRVTVLQAFVALFLVLIGSVAIAATTSAYSAVNPNIRGPDGKLVPEKLSTFPQLCEIYIADGTGETLTTPTAAVIKSATLSLVSAVRGSAVADGPNGTCKVTKPGLYRITSNLTSATTDTASTDTMEVFRKDGAGASAAMSPTLIGKFTTLTGSLQAQIALSRLVRVTAAEAAATGGVVFSTVLTASTGNAIIKGWTMSVQKVDELDPASP